MFNECFNQYDELDKTRVFALFNIKIIVILHQLKIIK